MCVCCVCFIVVVVVLCCADCVCIFCVIVKNIVSVPERSKGVDSSSTVFALVGSNPTADTTFYFLPPNTSTYKQTHTVSHSSTPHSDTPTLRHSDLHPHLHRPLTNPSHHTALHNTHNTITITNQRLYSSISRQNKMVRWYGTDSRHSFHVSERQRHVLLC